MQKKIKALLPEEYPNGKEILETGKTLGDNVNIGKTLFMLKYDVSSEREFKEKMMSKKQIMYHFQYGLTDFETSKKGLESIYKEATDRGARPDRFGICLDRAMGLPEEMRKSIPRETGLKLNSSKEWELIGQIVPIQPHFGDHIIGSPASVENTINALNAGVTTVGNFSQYFTYEYPQWKDNLTRTINTIKACGIMSRLRDRGVMIHSNIEDGFASQFTDCCSIIGWAMMEYYIVEELIGAKLTHCFGNLTDNPKMRMAYLLALDEIHGKELVGSMVNGNTISATEDLDRNFAPVASYCIFDMVMQMKNPTGHAIGPLPVTELIRIPSWEENVQIQVFGNQLEKEATRIYENDLINFQPVYELKDVLIEKGRQFYNNILDCLSDIIDVQDPLQLMIALKKIGPVKLEEYFNVTKNQKVSARKKPAVPTKMFEHVLEIVDDEIKNLNLSEETKESVKGKKLIIASTDVHEFGKMVISEVLKSLDIEVVDLGSSVEADTVIDEANKHKPDAIVISTYNGLALTYGKSLLANAQKHQLETPIFMGGRLNEDTGEELPIDVTEDLKEIGIIISGTLNNMIQTLGQLNATN